MVQTKAFGIHQSEPQSVWSMAYSPEHAKEKQAAAAKRYRARNLEKVKGQQKEWHAKNAPKNRERAAKWKNENPDRLLDYYLRRKYGIKKEEYDRLLELQQGRCAICAGPPVGNTRGGPATRFDVDHDHITGVVRGLLCHPCNLMLAGAADRPEILRRGAEYLCR